MKIRQFALGVFCALLVASLTTVLLELPPSEAGASDLLAGTCTTVTLPVALGPNLPVNQAVHGTLCLPQEWSGVREVDVLAHGATYNNTYWNWPIETNSYSYVNDTLSAGRATFAYDEVGAGQSSHPPLSTTLTVDGEAYVLHQALNWLRAQHKFDRSAIIGHSFGSVVAVQESAVYHDENLLVLTGFTHMINLVGATALGVSAIPALADPEFRGQGLDIGYLTTAPGTRGTLFYSQIADPLIIAYDEAHKDVFSSTLLIGALAQLEQPALLDITNRITAPVLEAIGGEDLLLCGVNATRDCTTASAVRSFDAPYFTHAASFDVGLIPQTGHDLALHPTASSSFALINNWLLSH